MSAALGGFRSKLVAGDNVFGPFMKSGDPAFVEVAGYAGFDFVILDMEHGPSSVESMQNNVRAAIIAGALPIIRVERCDEVAIGKALDIGALGVQVPQIENADQARAAVKAAKFHPLGARGVCRFVRAANYSSLDKFEYFKSANETMVILQLEGKEALDNVDAILAVDGIDLVFIGPYDLSQSLGVPGQIDHPMVADTMRYIVQKAKDRGIAVGTFVDTLANLSKWKSVGIQYLSYSVDVGIFYEACSQIVAASRAAR